MRPRRVSRIRVTTNCVANGYAMDNERIIEFSSEHGGGLISFVLRDDGTLTVDVYRTDPTVFVLHSSKGQETTTAVTEAKS